MTTIRNAWTPITPQPTTAWEDEPIKRLYCLAIDWQDDDPMPAVCWLGIDHDGDHKAPDSGLSMGKVSGPEITWANDEATTKESAA